CDSINITAGVHCLDQSTRGGTSGAAPETSRTQDGIRMERLSIGCAAGFSGDRTDAAAPVVETLIRRGGPSALIFETLAERTLALAQLARKTNPDSGYEPLLDELVT